MKNKQKGIEYKLKDFKAAFDAELKKFLDLKITEAKKISPWAADFTKNLKNYLFAGGGGKRIRPALVYFAYLAGGGKNKKAIMHAAMSVELLHAFFLIQDDIIDRDNLRHGQKTMHFFYEKWAEANLKLSQEDCRHYGISQAICIADIAMEMSFRSVSGSAFDEKTKILACNKLSDIVFNTAIGEMSDVLAEELDAVDEKKVLNILDYKTARYTFLGTISLGAIFANRSEKYIKKIIGYALPLGIAFQIQDDILGAFGSEVETGKPVGADIREGKKTLLAVKALELGNAKQKKDLKYFLGNRKISKKQIESARKIMIETGSLEYSKKLAEKLAAEADRAIEKSGFDLKSKEFFIELAEFIIKRKY